MPSGPQLPTPETRDVEIGVSQLGVVLHAMATPTRALCGQPARPLGVGVVSQVACFHCQVRLAR